jgi:hypothetical protein
MNLYGFANGDPINFSDPFGLDPCEHLDPKEDREAWLECKGKQLAQDDPYAVEADLNLAGCALASGNLAGRLVLDVLTVASGAQVVYSGARFGGATLWSFLSSSLGSSAGGSIAVARGGTLVGALQSETASSLGSGAASLTVGSVEGGGLDLSSLVPFSGTTMRRDAVAQNCATFSRIARGG